MGETDIRFKAFIRFVLDALREVSAEKDENKRSEKMARIIENLQKTLEDQHYHHIYCRGRVPRPV